jgi:hypothetical protein
MRSPLYWLKHLDPPVIIAFVGNRPAQPICATDLSARRRTSFGGELHSAAAAIGGHCNRRPSLI